MMVAENGEGIEAMLEGCEARLEGTVVSVFSGCVVGKR